MGDGNLRFLWCDGLFPQETIHERDQDWVTGTALISEDDGRSFVNYGFRLRITRSSEQPVDWKQLLPVDGVTGWMSIDRKRKTIEMDLGAAR